MKSEIRKRSAASAFTLMEVMLAVTILGLVVTAVYATWSTAITAWKRGNEVTESFQRQRIVMEALEDLAKSAVYFNTRPELYEFQSDRVAGLGDTISFVTASDVLLPRSEATFLGLRRVTLALQRDRNGATYLAIANSPAVVETTDEEQPQWHVLSADVAGFSVQYRHPRDGTWLEKWEDPLLVPSAIMFTVAFRGDDKRLPPLVVTRAVELPGAELALELMGQPLNKQDTGTDITQQDVKLSDGGGDDTGADGGGSDDGGESVPDEQ